MDKRSGSGPGNPRSGDAIQSPDLKHPSPAQASQALAAAALPLQVIQGGDGGLVVGGPGTKSRLGMRRGGPILPPDSRRAPCAQAAGSPSREASGESPNPPTSAESPNPPVLAESPRSASAGASNPSWPIRLVRFGRIAESGTIRHDPAEQQAPPRRATIRALLALAGTGAPEAAARHVASRRLGADAAARRLGRIAPHERAPSLCQLRASPSLCQLRASSKSAPSLCQCALSRF